MLNFLNTAPYAKNCKYVLYKAVPYTDDYWFETASDDYEWINQRAMQLQDKEGMWVFIDEN